MAHRPTLRRTRSVPAAATRRWPDVLAALEDAAAESLASTYTVVWQVQMDHYGTWVDFEAHHTELIERAWMAMTRTIVLGPAHEPDRWLIDLSRLLQKNQWSDTIRNIRRVLVTNR